MRDLCPHLRHAVQRVTAADAFYAANGALHKAFVDGFLHQRAARTSAHFTLVKGKERKTFQRLIEKCILFVHHVGEENVR